MFRDAVLQAAADAIEHLGEPVTLEDGSEILGVFKYPSDSTELRRAGTRSGGGIVAPSRDPELSVRDSDAATLQRGSTVTVRGEQFDVTDRFPTGNGLVRLELVEKQGSDPAGTTTWR